MAAMHWLRKNSDIKNIEWDLETITPGDYTVEFIITDTFYEKFRSLIFDIENGDK